MHILLVNFNDDTQYNNHYLYEPKFSNYKFIDVSPNYDLSNGCGRIIMFQWNEFIRKIKKYLLIKKENQQQLIIFWNKTRKKVLKNCNPKLPIPIINNIMSFI
tara:strand:- start:160 stop:468 length:309 start_codon:yes stop_codon:yes gene_type:complete